MDEHVGDETPRFLPLVGLVRERAVPDALVQSHPLLLRLPHGVVDEHRQLRRGNKHRRLRGASSGGTADRGAFLERPEARAAEIPQ